MLEAGRKPHLCRPASPAPRPTICGRPSPTGRWPTTSHRFVPKPGDAIFLPAGTVHSVGGDAVVFEVSENSDVTFRLVRLGPRRCRDRPASGAPGRPGHRLHRLWPRARSARWCRWWRRRPRWCASGSSIVGISACGALRGRSPFTVGAAGEPRVLVCTEGAGQVEHGGETYAVGRGDVMLLPAAVGACAFRPERPSDLAGSQLLPAMKKLDRLRPGRHTAPRANPPPMPKWRACSTTFSASSGWR